MFYSEENVLKFLYTVEEYPEDYSHTIISVAIPGVYRDDIEYLKVCNKTIVLKITKDSDFISKGVYFYPLEEPVKPETLEAVLENGVLIFSIKPANPEYKFKLVD